MEYEQITRELKNLYEKEKDKFHGSCQFNPALMADDCLRFIQDQHDETTALQAENQRLSTELADAEKRLEIFREAFDKQARFNHRVNGELVDAQAALSAYRQAEAEGRMVRAEDRRIYTETGNNLWLVYDGEAIQVMHCGADIDADGKVYATLAADDKIFPYREADAEHDTDPTDWCRNTVYLTSKEFKEMVYGTEESARAAMQEVEK